MSNIEEYKRVFILGAGSSISHTKGKFPTINQFFIKAQELCILNKYGSFQNVGKYRQNK